MEYVIERLVKLVCEEICEDTLHPKPLFTSHALLLAQSIDYVRNAQARTILKPIIDQLLTTFKDKKQIATKLVEIAEKLRYKSAIETGYAGGNILNLLNQLQVDLTGYDFSHLTIWQADLQNVDLHNVNFQNADLSKSVFAETLGSALSVAFSPDGKLVAA